MRDDLSARVEATAALLWKVAIEAEMVISADGRVGADDAGTLLGLKPKTLANLRAEGGGPFFYSRPVGSSRTSYRIDELAAHIERGRRG